MSPAAPPFRDLKRDLEALLNRHFPLAKAMGAQVEEASSTLVRLAFPLEPNVNRSRTAFGGSLYSASALAGWGLLWCVLRERRLADADIVIASSGERFIRPVEGRFIAESSAPSGAFELSLNTLRRKDRARADVQSEIFCKGASCVLFRGTYGLLRKTPGNIVAETNLLDSFGV